MTYQVVIESTGDVIEVNEGQTILDAALRNGVSLPHACGHGLCSTCKVDVLEGEVEQGEASPFALMDFEREEGKCLACCATPLSDLVIDADIEIDDDAKLHAVKDFIGTVSRIVDLTPRIKGIFIALEGEGIAFQAGQYINVKIPGLEDAPRAFSIASPPSEKNIVELNVCRVPDGAGTAYMHDQLKVGDPISFTGPYGSFFVRYSQPEPVMFIAGGSGLSSLKSMLLDLLEQADTRPITFSYGARSQDELYYRELFESLAKQYGHFEFVPALSEEPAESNWQGARGFVHEALEQHFDGKFSGYKAYLCGPPPMIDACVSTLMKGRLFERDIYTENFFTRANKNEKPKSPLFKSI